MRTSVIVVALAVMVATPAPAAPQDTLTLQVVLDRLGRYLTEYAERLPATIADEHYEQSAGRAASREHVALDSEFGIMSPSGRTGWLGLRDVFSVNGRAVADREERLQKLFRQPSASAIEQARRIARENARFNVGPVLRTINDPAVVLEMLDRRNAARMRFSKDSETVMQGRRVWAIEYVERRRPTIVRTEDGKDLPARGAAWVEPDTGRLLRARAVLDRESSRRGFVQELGFTATVDVEFRADPGLGFWVPSSMTERYQSRDGTFSSGEATYTNYRRFAVDTRVVPQAP